MTSTLEFQSIPSTLPLFAQLAVSKGRSDKTLAKPLSAEARGIVASRNDVRRYLAVCGGEDRLGLPILYPQVMGTPLTMALMAHPEFPLPALGLVHMENHVFQIRAPRVGEKLDFRVEIPSLDRTPRGYEFNMRTEVRDESGELIWHSTALILSRAKDTDQPRTAREPRKAPTPSDWPLMQSYRLESNLGRRYARVSGDFNPIHLTAPTAKLLGFKQAIIHGMWSAAAIAASLGTSEGACEYHCEFKTPLFLPGKGNLHAQQKSGQTSFLLQDARSFRPILTGSYKEGAA